ncbi:MAG: phosphatase PAP2 family protein [Clostridiales bacterium]|nr:phosphatase PAP2 family protein [Clostridiales bacterium]
MEKSAKRKFITGALLLVLFVIFTLSLKIVDVKQIGPMGTSVGYAALNSFISELFGKEHIDFYNITDYLGIVAILTAFGFAVFGAYQLISRKSFKKVDTDIYVLAAFYIAVMAAYVFFEIFVVNYRPVLLSESPEASYPSSHTMVTVCVMAAAIMQFKSRIKNKAIRNIAVCICAAIIVLTVLGRLISGVHWFTDILGGLILSASLISLYSAAVEALGKKE